MKKPCKKCNIRKRWANTSRCLSCYKTREIKKQEKKAQKKKVGRKLTDQQICEKMRKRCVKLAKDISKIKDDYKCQYCGVGKPQRQVHSHHIFHEGMFRSMSADPDNLLTLCASHHQGGMWMKSNSGFNFHNSPRESTEWLIETFSERYTELKERSQIYIKIDIIYWTKKLGELKEIIEEYK